MQSVRSRSVLVFLAVIVAFAQAAAQGTKRPMTIDDVLDIKAVSSPQISPDGTRVVYTVRQWESAPGKADRKDARPHVWLVPADSAQGPARQITFGERGESSPDWSPDGRFVSFVAARGAGEGEDAPRPQVWIMHADGGEAWKVTDAKEGVGSYAWSKDARQIAYLSRDPLSKEADEKRKRRDDAKVFESEFQPTHVWVIDVESKQATQVTTGAGFTVGGFTWAPDGVRIAFSAKPTPLIRDERDDLSVVTIATKQIEKIASTAATERSPAWSPDGRTIAFMAVANPNTPYADGMGPRPLLNAHLMLYDVATRQTRDASSADFDHNPGTPIWTPDSKQIRFLVSTRVYRPMFAYDLLTGRYQQETPELMISGFSASRDGARRVLTVDSSAGPADLRLIDASPGSMRALTNANPQMAALALGEAEVISWKTDGGPIEGVLLKPANYQAGRKYPLLVDIHGGPTGAHGNGFHADGQYWAGQGWAVLYPNPRGSSNYGEKFMQANIRDWGGGDYRDIMAGVDEVIKRGVADSEKLAVMGWSYGGYMTCWVVSQTARFKAAMMGAGLSNLFSMYGTTDIPGYIATFYSGYPARDTLALYLERSGLTYVDKVKTPLLILQGAQDERVPIGQSMEFYRALKDRGKTVELVFYPREGHGLTEYYHQRDRLQRQFEWISKHTLGVSSPTPAPAEKR